MKAVPQILKKIFFSAIISLFFVGFTPVGSGANNPPMKVLEVPETVAGYATILESSRGTPNTEVIFRVEQPENGGVVEIPQKTNAVGVATADFLGFHTRRAGIYRASVYYRSYSEEKPQITAFKVYPDSVSATRSSIGLQKSSLPADNEETSLLTVRIADQYGNAIPNHRLTLVSSRQTDTILEAMPQATTDQYGQKVFEVSCREAGISYFTALDQQTGIILEDRAKLICFEPEAEVQSSGFGSFLGANIFGNGESTTTTTAGPVQRFALEFIGPNNQPNTAVIGSDQNYFTVTAVDASGNQVKNYNGTILIAVPNDSGALLPSEGQYTFGPKDEGEIQFSLAFQFSQLGSQKIQVVAYDPKTGQVLRNISGETEVMVVQSADVPVDTGNDGATDTIQIKNPTEGSRHATGNIPVTIVGESNTDYRVLVDGLEAGTLESDSDGLAFTTLAGIADGEHEMYIQKQEGDRSFSQTITFRVDSKAPILEDARIYPAEDIETGTVVTITVLSEGGLNTATVRLNGKEYALKEDLNTPGNYERSLTTPELPGQYAVDIILADALGNESKFLSQILLDVSSPEQLMPTTPLRLEATSQPESVKLEWEPSSNQNKNVALYVIYSGNSEFNLQETGSVPATKTAFTVKNLEAGREYVFAITTVDTTGKESLKSETVTARPLFADGTGDPNDGLHATALEVRAIAKGGAVQLAWERSAKSPEMYVVRYGIQPKTYSSQVVVSRLENTTTIKDLIPGVAYYFRVYAVKGTRSTGELYPEISVIPQQAKAPLYSAPFEIPTNVQSGPETALLFVGISLLLTAFLFFFRRQART